MSDAQHKLATVKRERDSYTPTVIELFAGVGGFRLGLEKSGWKTVWSNQWEPATRAQHASSCCVSNFGGDGHSNEDIALAIDADLSGVAPIPDSDLLVGGFPCQDYSVAKSLSASAGLAGKKGVLWWEIHRLVSAKKPKLVFLENVDRLLKSPSKQRGRDFAVMLRTLGDLGYFIEWRIVNAAEYGFSQRRIRVFIVAVRLDVFEKGATKPENWISDGVLNSAFPISGVDRVTEFQLDQDPSVISSSFNMGGRISPFKSTGAYLDGVVITANAVPKLATTKQGSLGSVLIPDSEVPTEYWIDESRLPEWQYLKGAKNIERVSATGHAYKYSEGKMSFPDSLEKPSRTILTGEGGTSPSRFKHVIRTKAGHRRLTPVELERLSGFPDDWTKFDANGNQLSDARRAFFIGNALVVGLIEMVGKELKSRFFS
jgi:DNA (cytosine-5)-methyltransferase 1